MPALFSSPEIYDDDLQAAMVIIDIEIEIPSIHF